MSWFTKYIHFIVFGIFFSSSINLKAETSDDHCHCVNAQQQIFEYVDEVEGNEITQSTSKARTSPREILVQEKPENIWKVVNKGYGIPDPKKKWAKKVVKKYERWYSEHPVYTYRMFERTKRYIYYVVQEVKKRNMPMEIALLPIIESAYNPIARSNMKAVGSLAIYSVNWKKLWS